MTPEQPEIRTDHPRRAATGMMNQSFVQTKIVDRSANKCSHKRRRVIIVEQAKHMTNQYPSAAMRDDVSNLGSSHKPR